MVKKQTMVYSLAAVETADCCCRTFFSCCAFCKKHIAESVEKLAAHTASSERKKAGKLLGYWVTGLPLAVPASWHFPANNF
jgi:hypothetical protein